MRRRFYFVSTARVLLFARWRDMDYTMAAVSKAAAAVAAARLFLFRLVTV